jgi:hypothetical protein
MRKKGDKIYFFSLDAFKSEGTLSIYNREIELSKWNQKIGTGFDSEESKYPGLAPRSAENCDEMVEWCDGMGLPCCEPRCGWC